jgi:hypothetical protein
MIFRVNMPSNHGLLLYYTTRFARNVWSKNSGSILKEIVKLNDYKDWYKIHEVT